MAWRGRSRDWVERKYADYHLQKRKRMRAVRKPKIYATPYTGPKYTSSGIPIIRKQSDWTKFHAKRHAKRSAVVAAHAAKGAVRLGSRAMPFIGWGMMAYDVYQIADHLHDMHQGSLHQYFKKEQLNPLDIEPHFDSVEYMYPVIVGYENLGPVDFTRTL